MRRRARSAMPEAGYAHVREFTKPLALRTLGALCTAPYAAVSWSPPRPRSRPPRRSSPWHSPSAPSTGGSAGGGATTWRGRSLSACSRSPRRPLARVLGGLHGPDVPGLLPLRRDLERALPRPRDGVPVRGSAHRRPGRAGPHVRGVLRGRGDGRRAAEGPDLGHRPPDGERGVRAAAAHPRCGRVGRRRARRVRRSGPVALAGRGRTRTHARARPRRASRSGSPWATR